MARAFVDHDGVVHGVGETWTFVRSDFLPYEDGLSLFVASADGSKHQIRLLRRPEAQGSIADALHDHFLPLSDNAKAWSLLLTRDSVCLADDGQAPHAAVLDVDRAADGLGIATTILAVPYLAWVGSTATWSLTIATDRVVFGYQCSRPSVGNLDRTSLLARAVDVDRLHLTYLAQADPERA